MPKDVWEGVEPPLSCFIARHKDEQVLKESASGGAFTGLASSVLKMKGVVFGASYSQEGVVHSWADAPEGLAAFRSSKYVQSNLGTAYKDVLHFIQQGRVVLFSGTPCQVAGLLAFLCSMHVAESQLNLLYTVDFVCHGVGSPYAFKIYLEEKRAAGFNVRALNMRSKRFGYRSSSMELVLDDGEKRYISTKMDDYLDAFYSNLILRPSCHSCGFKSARHDSDLTLWDSWHAEEVLKIRKDNKGFTNIAVQSKKGNILLESARDFLDIWEVPFEAIRPQKGGMMLYSTKLNPKRKDFMALLSKDGVKEAMRCCEPKGALEKIKEACRPALYACGLLDGIRNAKRNMVRR